MILVTGGAGYIGSVLVATLLKNKYSIRVFDSLLFGDQSLKSFKDKIELVKGDIRNPPKKIFKDIKAVIHLAGLSNDPTANFDPKANYQINAQATIALARLAKKNKVERFIFGSSCSLYDQGINNPQKLQDESSKINPTAPYSLSKLIAEEGILPLAGNKFSVTVVRKGTVMGYSPRMRYDLVVNTMVKDAFLKGVITLFACGKQWRPLISVNDAALGYLKVLEAPINRINKEIINLLVANFQIFDIAERVKKALIGIKKTKLIIQKDMVETRSYKVANKKMRTILAFYPQETIEQTVKKICSQIKKQTINDFNNPSYYNIETLKLLYSK